MVGGRWASGVVVERGACVRQPYLDSSRVPSVSLQFAMLVSVCYSGLGFGWLQRGRWLRYRGRCVLRRGEAAKVAALRGRPERSKEDGGRSTVELVEVGVWHLLELDWHPRNKVDSETVILQWTRRVTQCTGPQPLCGMFGSSRTLVVSKNAGQVVPAAWAFVFISPCPGTYVFFYKVRGHPKLSMRSKKLL